MLAATTAKEELVRESMHTIIISGFMSEREARVLANVALAIKGGAEVSIVVGGISLPAETELIRPILTETEEY